MHKFFSAFVLATLLFAAPLFSNPTNSPMPFSVAPEALQSVAVSVVTERGSGSGVLFLGTNGAFCWTAFHVVSDSKKDVALVKQIVVNGRTVGSFTVMAEIISGNSTQDLAVLRPRSAVLFKNGAKSESANFIPKLGAPIFHIGSFLGAPGAESFSSGTISYVGRIIDGLLFDQTDLACFPGSSGGGVWSADGKLIGLITSGFSENFSFLVPIRRMHEWAKVEGHPEWLPDSP